MKLTLKLTFALTAMLLSSSALAAVVEVRGTTTNVRDTCGNPPRLQINHRLDCTYGYCIVRDRNIGIVMDGYYPTNEALLDGSFKLNNGCTLTLGYSYLKPRSRTSFRLTQYFITTCPDGNQCGTTYRGTVRG